MDNGNTALMCYGPADQARYEQVSQILRGHGLNPVNEDRHRIIRYAGDHDIALAILSLEAGLPDTTMGVQLATGLLSVKPELPVYIDTVTIPQGELSRRLTGARQNNKIRWIPQDGQSVEQQIEEIASQLVVRQTY